MEKKQGLQSRWVTGTWHTSTFFFSEAPSLPLYENLPTDQRLFQLPGPSTACPAGPKDSGSPSDQRVYVSRLFRKLKST